jgi:hypothetical protein
MQQEAQQAEEAKATKKVLCVTCFSSSDAVTVFPQELAVLREELAGVEKQVKVHQTCCASFLSAFPQHGNSPSAQFVIGTLLSQLT